MRTKRTAKWQKKITMGELKHLRANMHSVTLRGFTEMAAKQKIIRDKGTAAGYPPCIAEPCWECKSIARKLGLPV